MDLINIWQHLPEHTISYFSLFGFKIHFYSLMYIIAYFITLGIIKYKIKKYGYELKFEVVEKFLNYAFVGVILGARFGYVLFYNLSYYINHPLEILLPFKENGAGDYVFTGISGMSYHGGVIGAFLVVLYFSRKQKVSFFAITDIFLIAIPLGYTFGRIGNFLNNELYGRVTTSSIGMYFPTAPTRALRHPSQLYEAFFEGIVLFLILWFVSKKNPKKGTILGLYLVGYGVFRFCIEYFRQPDAQLGFIFFNVTMGQILCFSMISIGSGILAYVYRDKLIKSKSIKK